MQPTDNPDVQELVLWFVDTDSIKVFDPISIVKQILPEREECLTESIHLALPEQLPDTSLQEQRTLLMELFGRMPMQHFWDPDESQLLVVEWSGCSSSLSSVDRKKLDSNFSLRTNTVSQVHIYYTV